MFDRFRKEKTSIYDAQITKVLTELTEQPVESEEYATAIRHLETLTNLKTNEVGKKVTADTKWLVLGNIIGIMAIINHERVHVIGSKATSLILKPK